VRGELRRQALELAERVRASPADERPRLFYAALRAGPLPYLSMELGEPDEIFQRTFDALFILSGASLPLTLGFTMHAYTFASLVTAPIPAEPFSSRRHALAARVRAERWLVGVSSLGQSFVDGVSRDVTVRVREDGALVADGAKGFQSMASEADVLVLTARLEDGRPGFFATPIKGSPTATLLAPRFGGGPLALADTRGIRFDGHVMAEEELLCDDETLHQFLNTWTTSWFEGLVSGTYLGGAARALEEVRTFARARALADGVPLAQLDGFAVDVGRLAIELRSAIALAGTFGPALSRATAIARSPSHDYATKIDAINELSSLASLVKHRATRVAEDVVQGARRLVGTSGMHAGLPLAELSAQIVFGPMHPLISAEHERIAGRDALAESPGPTLFDHVLP
jgi:alkylation response protein AidB-like acyl-CoA dehydrogenase